MPREFDLTTEVVVAADPDEVWAAIATGPGIDSWYMGRTELEPHADGTVRLELGAYAMESRVTAWDPPHRFAHRTAVEPDGTFRAFEYLVEGRGGGSTVIRAVLSGFLGADGWETEYDALSQDGPIYPHTLGQYLTYFRGQVARPVTAFGAVALDRESYWRRLTTGLGLPGAVTVGDEVHLRPDGLPAVDGIVDYHSPTQLGVRSADALYRFVHGLHRTVVLGHHLFAPEADESVAEVGWRNWLERTFA